MPAPPRPPRLTCGEQLTLAPTLAATLRAHRARQLEERPACGPDWKDEWELVFTAPGGRTFSKHTLAGQFKRHLARAGLPAIRYHDLRHSCASLLVAQGVHPRVIMEILGHSTIAVTMNTYSHVLPQAQREAANLMEHVLGLAAAGD